MFTVTGRNAPEIYPEVIKLMREYGEHQDSRNGEVKALPAPLLMGIDRPRQRLITCPTRNANPFFHCLEFVWMMAGRRDSKFVGDLVKQMYEYAEPHGNFHGAYGFRWLNHFNGDQVVEATDLLYENPESRRAVIAMWDPNADLLRGHSYKDIPCNTHLYLRIVDSCLDMTVCNRSNDVIWGMLGANVCHFTMLQELIANMLKIDVGSYYVMTNNAHVYLDLPRYKDIMHNEPGPSIYTGNAMACPPILKSHENYVDFANECGHFCNEPRDTTGLDFLDRVAYPIWQAYTSYKDGNLETAHMYCEKVESEDWFVACHLWLSNAQRRSHHGG